MKAATWNVNSLRVRLPHVTQWLGTEQADILCLQETKLVDADFPVSAIKDAGYHVAFSGQKTYNGVATLSTSPPQDIVTALPGLDDPQRRLLAATIDGVRVVNVYIPNGQEVGSEKYQYKLMWLESLLAYLQVELKSHTRLMLLGDFNIAPADEDVHDPEQWRDKVLCSEPERTMFQQLLGLDLGDVYRKFDQEPNTFSWWDYRAAGFRRNLGLRIDHILCSQELYRPCAGCVIDNAPRKWERPSDHTPVVAEFAAT